MRMIREGDKLFGQCDRIESLTSETLELGLKSKVSRSGLGLEDEANKNSSWIRSRRSELEIEDGCRTESKLSGKDGED